MLKERVLMSGKKQALIGIPIIIAFIFFLWGIAACNNDNDSSYDTDDDYISETEETSEITTTEIDYDTREICEDCDVEHLVTTQSLIEQYPKFLGHKIKTSIKVTNISKNKKVFYYRRDYSPIDLAIKFTGCNKSIKKGDIITVSGYFFFDSSRYLGMIENAKLEPTSNALYVDLDKLYQPVTIAEETKTKTIEPDTKEDITSFYTEGQYKVGVDIPAGQYIAYPEYFYGNSGYFAVTSDANGNDIISNDYFSGQRYFTVSDGQYLELSGCTAYSVSDKKAIDSSAGYLDEGQYKAGDDITEGLFIIYANDGESAYYCVSSDANGEDIIANENFENQAYVYVESGQYLQVSDGLLYGSDNVKKVDTSSGYLEEGQYKVGIDISPGTYNVISTDSYGGYYCISSDANGDDIISNDNFDGNSYVTVQDEQYISLSGAKLKLN